MPTIGLMVHRHRLDAVALSREIALWAASRGVGTLCQEHDAELLGASPAVDGDLSTCDLLVSVGGDGTMLRAVRSLRGAGVPLLGVNLGQLGYLATVEESDALAAIERWLTGEPGSSFTYDDRMMLSVSVRLSGGRTVDHLALNEVVIEKREPGHTARLGLDIDGARFTSYVADGLIVSTPTGSTAYSLSARGPILSPRMRALLVTPVSPHMLFDRSLVLDPSERVRIQVLGHRQVHVAIDGDLAHTLDESDFVEVSAAGAIARFVRFGDQPFHQILKNKFGLEDR